MMSASVAGRSGAVLVELARRCVTRKRRDACWTARAAVSSSTDACIFRISEKNLLASCKS